MAWPAQAFEIDEIHHHRSGQAVVVVDDDNVLPGWKFRRAAENYDERVRGLSVRYGDCALKFSNKRYCLKVIDRNFGKTRWVGKTIWWATANDGPLYGKVKLNTWYDKSQHVSCHEFGHVVGIPHHNRRGCVGWGLLDFPSKIEIRKLRAVY